MTNSIADLTLGVGKQARAILALLEVEPDFAEYSEGFYQIDIDTRAWYNGRERGVSLVVRRMGFKGCLVITFGEHRNTDGIFVDSWEMPHAPMNGPTVADFSDEVYNVWNARTMFHYGEAGKAAKFIYEKMSQFYAGLEREVNVTPKWVETISGEA
jgi:hypothetical protein